VSSEADTLEAADAAYEFNGGKVEKEARDVAFETLKASYRDLGAYVQTVCGGSKEVILGAGMNVRKAPSQPVLPSTPPNVQAAPTKYFGELDVRWGASTNHRIYKVYQTEGDPSLETGWELIAETGKNRLLVKGLERFKTYSFRVVALGAAGLSPASDAATATAA
jgi:hypothetical protein